ncbi:hypothetical protein SSX86_028208 [Deinandra increscens subsp. villosa]|uniref:NB-ARC domain-containing protein n=1 Tax=Deinandra increscens subsp. villosa TaxID=3103831 RepID=A0AAP0C7J4_9ASTR
MEFVAPIVTPVIEFLIDRVKKNLGFWFSSKKYVTKMHERLSALNHKANDLKFKMEGNNANNLVVPGLVPDWLRKVEDVHKKAGDIPTGEIGCFKFTMRYDAGKGASDIFEEMAALENEVSNITWTNEPIPLGMVRSSIMPSTSEPAQDDDSIQDMFPSRQLIFKDVLKSLEPNCNTQKIALCGMGGVGKTTMMEEIEKVVRKRGLFKWVFRATAGQKSDVINAIQNDIAEYMGEALKETGRDARAARLGERFKGISENGTIKIFVILDDVWEHIDLKDIGLTSPLPNGFKILITSRDEKVCSKMDIEPSSIFKVVGLKKVEANALFWEIVRLPDGINSELHNIGEDILNKCGGLPLAIKTIASTLRYEEKDAWELAAIRLQRHDPEDLYAIVGDIFDISYDKLREEDKAIFILCGLFPDDFNIAKEELMRYGWGLHLFKKTYSLMEARQRTNTSIRNLIHTNLLTESDILGYVRMHDLARAFVLSNFLKFKQFSIVNHNDESEWPSEDTWESCERILVKCAGMSEFPQDFNYSNLSLLKLMNKYKPIKFREDFYKRMEKLKVLACDEIQYPLLQASLQCTTSLRTLCLHSCSLVDEDISFLGNLINLEVLSFSQSGIRKLPSTIGKLKRLKLLDLNGCDDLCIDDGVFQNLDRLEELYMRVCKGKAIKFTISNCDEFGMLSRKLCALEVEFFENNLQPKNVSFKKIQRFRISIGCSLEENSDYYLINEYSFKNSLKLVTNCNELLESKINELFSGTERLYLSVKDMTYVGDILKNPSQNSTFINLQSLIIFKCEDLTHIFTPSMANGLKILKSLTVASCHVLKSLVSFCDGVNVIELPQLADLNLSDLPHFTSIFPENNDSATHLFLNKEVVIPMLSELKVSSMKNLKQIWPGEETDIVSTLRKIEVNECDSLVNLFPSNPMRLLTHLEELSVKRCCSIEVLFNIDLSKIEKPGNTGCRLRSIDVEELKELREVWKINDENNSSHLQQPICCFQRVETINVKGCMKFTNVFTPTLANFDMGALWDIRINNGAEIDEFFDFYDFKYNMQQQENVAFTSYQLIHTFHHLRFIQMSRSDQKTVVFDIECPSIDREPVTTQQEPLVLLPYLEGLELRDMTTLRHVWKCNNWNEFTILHRHQLHSSFQNLIDIRLSGCMIMEYLFSPLMSELLSSLKTLTIVYCPGMIEVVSNTYDYKDEEMTTSTTTFFPRLDQIELRNLERLCRIGGRYATYLNHDQFEVGDVSWSLCQYSRQINIVDCSTLSSAITCYAAGKMQKLEKLRIKDCDSMIEVFETQNYKKVYQGSETTLPISRTKSITVHELPNLKILEISECRLLEYTFTFSTLESLKKLEELRISHCDAMKVIVRGENEDKSSSSSKVVMVFPRLKLIKLEKLPSLTGFFLGKNIDFQWPSLDYVMINGCPKMMVFTIGESTTPKLKHIHTGLGKHNLECGLNFHQISSPSSDSSNLYPAIAEGTHWSFCNLIEMDAKHTTLFGHIVPSNELLQLQVLEEIHLDSCGIKDIFEEVTNKESQTVVKFPKLREVTLKHLDMLNYIWTNNHWQTFYFPNLTRLVIKGCRGLRHVFTPSMIGSLMQLQELYIGFHRDIEVIVKKEEESDGKLGEIMFPCLKSLKLKYLLSLQGFYLGKENFVFPSMNTLVIKHCPKLRIFTEGPSIAPPLKLLKTCFGSFDAVEDINSFIVDKKQKGFVFKKLNKWEF